MKRAIVILLSFLFFISANAQLRSPDDFLGYQLGTHFTPHWKVIDYFKNVAANASSMVKMQRYGQTNEGRELLVAFVSAPENIQNLEDIRQNNLRLANLSADKIAA